MSAWKPILAALVIFAAGVVTGGLTVNLRWVPAPFRVMRPPGDPGPRPLGRVGLRLDAPIADLARRIREQLNLTPEQRERIEAIVRESQDRMRELRDRIMPETREEMRRLREQIRAELSPEQRRHFEEIFQQRGREGRGEGPQNRPPSGDRPGSRRDNPRDDSGGRRD